MSVIYSHKSIYLHNTDDDEMITINVSIKANHDVNKQVVDTIQNANDSLFLSNYQFITKEDLDELKREKKEMMKPVKEKQEKQEKPKSNNKKRMLI